MSDKSHLAKKASHQSLLWSTLSQLLSQKSWSLNYHYRLLSYRMVWSGEFRSVYYFDKSSIFDFRRSPFSAIPVLYSKVILITEGMDYQALLYSYQACQPLYCLHYRNHGNKPLLLTPGWWGLTFLMCISPYKFLWVYTLRPPPPPTPQPLKW